MNSGGTIFQPAVTTKLRRNWRNWLIGSPLQTTDAPHQTVSKIVGLAVFASDALSSTAYATQEIMVILAAAGTLAFGYVFPISLAIVFLMALVTISYEQTVHAYPGGGGAYIVARDNLGEIPAQAAGAALLTDYILTVAVSISSGIAQVVSAFPNLYPYRVEIAIVTVWLIMLINLRGVRESGITFAIPTYFFIIAMFLTIGIGFYRYLTGTLGVVVNPGEMVVHGALQAVTPFLLLHAFSSGTAALTGIEAISNGITAFKEPHSRNAGITLIWMAVILAALFLSISFLVGEIRAGPSEQETVISQLVRTVYSGQGVVYIVVIASTAVILVMAANTAFADFPRLSAIQANDGYLPRQLTARGSRLVFSRGIIALAVFASLLILIFQASVTRLIPLYAIGVFLSFTLSQTGMARRWWKSGHVEDRKATESKTVYAYDPNWKLKMAINGLGAFVTFIVMWVFAITKFKDGAWIILFVIPSLIAIFLTIHRHYRSLAQQLTLEQYAPSPMYSRHRVFILIADVHRGSLAALKYARMLSADITAVHVSFDAEDASRIAGKWSIYGDGTRLVILDSPYRLMIEPIMTYIERIRSQQQPNEILTIVVPQFVPRRWWQNLLHHQTAILLRFGLLLKPGVVIVEVPYQV